MTLSTPVERRRRFVRRALLSVSTILCSAMAQPVFAQSANTPQAYASAPADHLLITPNGVDLRSGHYDYKQTDLSIGGDGAAGLQLTRMARWGGIWGHVEPFANFTHNFDIVIAEKRVHGSNYYHGSGSDFRMIVRLGQQVETFDATSASPYFEQVSKSATARLTYAGNATDNSVVYTYQAPDGTIARFRPLGNGDCSSHIRCAFVSDLTYPDGTKLVFEYENPTPGTPNGTRLRSVVSTRGYALVLEYSGGSWNSIGKACVIDLARRSKPVDNVCPSDALATSSYTYATSTELVLATSTDASGAASSYQYGSSGGYDTIGFVKPGAQSPWLTNKYFRSPDQDTGSAAQDGVSEKVTRQDLADGQSFDVLIDNAESETEWTIQQDAGGDIVDGQGNRIQARYGFPKYPRTLLPGYDPNVPYNFSGTGASAVYQLTPGPISITDQLNHTTTFDYCDPTIAAAVGPNEPDRCVTTPLRSYTDPEGIKTDLTYDACTNVTQTKRHPKDGSPLPDLLITTTFDCLQPNSAHKPKMLTDANGNVTHWSYTSFGAPEWEAQAPPSSGAARPLTLYGYTQRSAYVQDPTGALSPTEVPVWLPATETRCQTVANVGTDRPTTPTCDPNAPRMTTSYEYGADGTADNLLPRGKVVTADGQSLRTCYAYDPKGNKIAETSPRAGLTSCAQ